MKKLFLLLIICIQISYAQEEFDEAVKIKPGCGPKADNFIIEVQRQLIPQTSPDPNAVVIVNIPFGYIEVGMTKLVLTDLEANPDIGPIKVNFIKGLLYTIEIDCPEPVLIPPWDVIWAVFREKIKPSKLVETPRWKDVTVDALTDFINPYFSVLGGEKFGVPISKIVGAGFSLGIGTQYFGPLESNQCELNLHYNYFSAGIFNTIGENVFYKKDRNGFNTVHSAVGFQIGVVPLLNYFELQYQKVTKEISEEKKANIREDAKRKGKDGTLFYPKFITGHYFNWEIRYPIHFFGSKRGKFYLANYQNEYHLGAIQYDMDIKLIRFDFKMDYMFASRDENRRKRRLNIEILFADIFSDFGYELAVGPSISLFTHTAKLSDIELYRWMINFRLKLSKPKL